MSHESTFGAASFGNVFQPESQEDLYGALSEEMLGPRSGRKRIRLDDFFPKSSMLVDENILACWGIQLYYTVIYILYTVYSISSTFSVLLFWGKSHAIEWEIS